MTRTTPFHTEEISFPMEFKIKTCVLQSGVGCGPFCSLLASSIFISNRYR